MTNIRKVLTLGGWLFADYETKENDRYKNVKFTYLGLMFLNIYTELTPELYVAEFEILPDNNIYIKYIDGKDQIIKPNLSYLFKTMKN